MQRQSNTKLNERGFASIVIALILIIVLALLTVGFAQLARREQQTALDKQKATQANYAAESGINSAYKDITTINPATGQHYINSSNASSTQCMTGPSGSAGTTKSLPASALSAKSDINAHDGVSYSCLLVTLQTSDVGSDNNPPGSGKHLNFTTQDPLTSLTIYWGSHNGNNKNFPADPTGSNSQFPTLGGWTGHNYPPVVQLSITPVSGSLSVQGLTQSTTNVFLYPSASGNNTCDTTTCGQGQILSGDCNPSASRTDPSLPSAASEPCSAKITGLGGQNYIVHYIDFYDPSDVHIYGTVDTGGGTPAPALFTGEPIIDVTGRARDVLKRLQARIFINNGNGGTPDDNAILPNGAVEAQNLCKRIQAAPSTADFPQGSTYDTTTSTSCDLSSLAPSTSPTSGGSAGDSDATNGQHH